MKNIIKNIKAAHKCFARANRLEKKYSEQVKKAEDLRAKAEQLQFQANEMEAKARQTSHRSAVAEDAGYLLMDKARTEYTKDMDGPSEEKAAAWNTFSREVEEMTSFVDQSGKESI